MCECDKSEVIVLDCPFCWVPTTIQQLPDDQDDDLF